MPSRSNLGTAGGLVLKALLLTAVVWALATACLVIPREFGRASPIWLTNGVVVAVLLAAGSRAWPAFLTAAFLGNIAANIGVGDPLDRALILSMSNAVEIALCAGLIRRLCGERPDLSRRRDLMLFAGVAVLACTVATGFAAMELAAAPGERVGQQILIWGVADALGLLLVTPALLAFFEAPRDLAERPLTAGGFAAMGLMLATLAVVLWWAKPPVFIFLLPPLLILTFKLERLGAAIAMLMMIGCGVVAIVTGHGPRELTSTPQGLLTHQMVLAVLTLSSLAVAQVLMERRRLYAALARAHAQTEAAQREALEQQLAARESAEAAAALKASFLADMTHELRTPLTSILGFTHIAMEAASEKVRKPLRHVEAAGQHLLQTVNDLLDFSKLEAGQMTIRPEAVSPRAIARSALDLMAPQAAAKGLTLTLDCHVDALTVSADPHRLRQVLLNFLSNAVKFTAKGEVVLRIDYDSETRALTAEVIDTGPGIASERLEAIFHRYVQEGAGATGTGLGLPICRQLAEAMGGRVGASSLVGHGSTFWIVLPAEEVEMVRGQAAPAPSSGEGRVLVVDDHAGNRELVRRLLTAAGLTVSEAADGGEAVERAQGEAFDAILMDLRMPRLDGSDALKLIRRRKGLNTTTPILAFTADAVDFEDRLIADGFDGAVRKPIEPAALVQAVLECVGARAG